jgi:hypothetical protein
VILLDTDHLTVLKSKSLLPLFLRLFGDPHTVEVAGSNPAPPIGLMTSICAFVARYLHATRCESLQIYRF